MEFFSSIILFNISWTFILFLVNLKIISFIFFFLINSFSFIICFNFSSPLIFLISFISLGIFLYLALLFSFIFINRLSTFVKFFGVIFSFSFSLFFSSSFEEEVNFNTLFLKSTQLIISSLTELFFSLLILSSFIFCFILFISNLLGFNFGCSFLSSLFFDKVNLFLSNFFGIGSDFFSWLSFFLRKSYLLLSNCFGINLGLGFSSSFCLCSKLLILFLNEFVCFDILNSFF